MNNARTIAGLERSIAQLTAIKDRPSAADAKTPGTPIKSTAKRSAVKRPMTPEHKTSISAGQKRRFSLKKVPAKKRAARITA